MEDEVQKSGFKIPLPKGNYLTDITSFFTPNAIRLVKGPVQGSSSKRNKEK